MPIGSGFDQHERDPARPVGGVAPKMVGAALHDDAALPHDYHFKTGDLYCGETPGHGVDINETLAAKYPYKPASLPVVRLEDGTMWNW